MENSLTYSHQAWDTGYIIYQMSKKELYNRATEVHSYELTKCIKGKYYIEEQQMFLFSFTRKQQEKPTFDAKTE